MATMLPAFWSACRAARDHAWIKSTMAADCMAIPCWLRVIQATPDRLGPQSFVGRGTGLLRS